MSGETERPAVERILDVLDVFEECLVELRDLAKRIEEGHDDE